MPQKQKKPRKPLIYQGLRGFCTLFPANNAGLFLSKSVQSYLDGKLDRFENRMASLLFKQAVELDMGLRTLADCVNLDEEYLRR